MIIFFIKKMPWFQKFTFLIAAVLMQLYIFWRFLSWNGIENSPKTSMVQKLVGSVPGTFTNQIIIQKNPISISESILQMTIFMLYFRKQCQEGLAFSS